MMRGIKTQSGKIAERAHFASAISGTQGVAAVFNQPQIVLTSECSNGIQIEDVAESMRHEHCLCAVTEGCLQLAHFNLIFRNGDIDKNWNQAILNYRVHRRGKARGHGNNFVTWIEAPFFKLRGGKSAHCK